MKFFTTYDANSEAKLDDVLDGLDVGGFEEYFAERFYDDSGIEIAVVLMCRDPHWNFKQRTRFSKSENCLYMDLMLDLERMRTADSETKKRIVAEKFIEEIPLVVAKYKFKDFDLGRLAGDLGCWFKQNAWL